MSRNKHSYIPFYMDDWSAGVAHMARPVWSLYFQICLYNWDKAKPISPARLQLITGDLGEATGEILSVLMESGHIEQDADGYFSPRAINEGMTAFKTWQRKSEGGRKGGAVKKSTPEKLDKQTGSTPSRTPSTIPKDIEKTRQHNQNQNQNQIACMHAGKKNVELSDEAKADAEALQKIREAEKISEKIKSDTVAMVEAWNAMASKNSQIPQVTKMTDKRIDQARAIVIKHGIEKITEAINSIPLSSFLSGKKGGTWLISFDWLCKDQNLTELLAGRYHNRGEKPEADIPVAPPPPKPDIGVSDQDDDRIPKFRQLLEKMAGPNNYQKFLSPSHTSISIDGENFITISFRTGAEAEIRRGMFEQVFEFCARQSGLKLKIGSIK